MPSVRVRTPQLLATLRGVGTLAAFSLRPGARRPGRKRISPATRRPVLQQAVAADSRLDDILVISPRTDMDHRRQSAVVASDEVDGSSQSVPPDESTRESLTTAGSEPGAFSSCFWFSASVFRTAGTARPLTRLFVSRTGAPMVGAIRTSELWRRPRPSWPA